MSWNYALVEREGPLTIITINRPESHNALNGQSHRELEAIFDEFAADDSQWVAILTGSGTKAFCAGLDLKEQADNGNLASSANGFGGLTDRTALTKPIIAAVNGAAMGGGFELALACDLIVASSNAVFALPEVRVGLAALAGGLQRLPQQIGLKAAMGMLLTGRRVSAAEGEKLGFVNEVTDGDVMVLARRWAEELLACSPLSIRATKESVLRSLARPTLQAMQDQWALPAMVAMLGSQDAIEGPRAFSEKRQPVWQGR